MKMNQYQEMIKTLDGRVFIVDYLVGDIQEVDSQQEFTEIFDEETKDLADQYEAELEKIPQTVMTAVLIPTYGCNLKCAYCYEGNITNTNDYSKLNEDTVISAIRKIKEFYNYESIQFVMLGGEPILGKNLIWFEKFFSKFSKLDIPYEVSCISNGVNAHHNIDIIKRIGVSEIQITLDGMEEQQNVRRPTKDPNINVFENIVKSIDQLLESNIKVNVRINVDEGNIPELANMHHFFDKKGWWDNECFSAYIYPISFNGNDENAVYSSENEMLEMVTQELLKLDKCYFSLDFHGLDFANEMLKGEIFYPSLTFCEASTNQYVFNDTGKVFTCWWGTGIDAFTLSENNAVLTDTFMKNIGKWHDRKINVIPECITCKYRFVCGGGCSYKAHLNHNDFSRGNCAPFTANIEVFLNYLIKAGLI